MPIRPRGDPEVDYPDTWLAHFGDQRRADYLLQGNGGARLIGFCSYGDFREVFGDGLFGVLQS